ncbi:hypothetical protein [Nonomuraea jabiensis]|uniref:hypothetical protein n=1 Tax=Nonomuraea jabiensis TaxID=882448 RepID=UPI0036CB495C
MLSLRDLNRTTLARRHLIDRYEGDVADVVHRLVGLQEPRPPYPRVWSRFARDDLHARMLMRATM